MASRSARLALIVLALVATSCRHGGTPQTVDIGTYLGGQATLTEATPVFGAHGMVSSNSEPASAAGAEILKAGGNAVDAAVATGFALAVTYPFAGNIGGGGFMNIHMADGRNAAIDYREVAPLAATRDMYVDPATGKLTNKSVTGHLASGVPGAVAGMAEALAKYGSMSLAAVMAPAIRLAKDGFIVDSALFRSLRGNRAVPQFAGKALFYPGGEPLQPGTRFVQAELARTLEIIAARGPAGFYTGEVAEALVAEEVRGGGIITMEDLRRYKPEWRTPIRSTYRGYTLLTMPPASSGGITMTETLNILETFGPLPRYGSAGYTHLLTEAFRRAFIDRNEKLADPAFVKVPIEQLTSKAYARQLAAGIDRNKATKTPAFKVAREPEHTTHYSTADSKGNVVATTTTLNGGFGSGVWVPKAGFFMNNEMDDFAAQPGSPNMFGLVQGEANAIAPGKRMLSAMAPTIVLDKDGKVLLVVGAAGGPRIITTTTEVILNVIEHNMSLADAMRAPRLHHQSIPDTLRYEAGAFSDAVADSLRAMGHALQRGGGLANANAIMRVSGGWIGVREPRSTGASVGH
ncbi:MAG: gamma-glutamyltransferase [Gemmatimonadaceae bacterium]|jgi:gamma-glutamyltranspeptidase/glutathione hydrolase